MRFLFFDDITHFPPFPFLPVGPIGQPFKIYIPHGVSVSCQSPCPPIRRRMKSASSDSGSTPSLVTAASASASLILSWRGQIPFGSQQTKSFFILLPPSLWQPAGRVCPIECMQHANNHAKTAQPTKIITKHLFLHASRHHI